MGISADRGVETRGHGGSIGPSNFPIGGGGAGSSPFVLLNSV